MKPGGKNDAMSKEMENAKVAFKILPDWKKPPIGYQFVQCNIVLDINMEDFRQKARLVARDYMTKAPAVIITSVVSRETVRTALKITAFNDLEIKLGDILNAYAQAPVTEKVWTTLCPEFGMDAGKTTMIVRALHGLKSAGAAFRSHLAICMESLEYESCKVNPDPWLKQKIRTEMGCTISPIYCVMWMIFFVSTTMEMLYFSSYTSHFN